MKELRDKNLSKLQISKPLGYGLAVLILLLLAVLAYRLFFACKPLSLSKGDSFQARIIIAPGVYHIGDIIPVSLEVEARKGLRFDMPDLSNIGLGQLEILSKSERITEKPWGGIRQKFNYQLTAWEAGKQRLKGFKVPYQSKTGVQKVYPVGSRFIHIKSLLPKGKSETQLAALSVKKPKKPVGMPPRYFILWWALGILAGFGLLCLAIQYLKRLKNRKPAMPAAEFRNIPPKEAAHLIALRRLEALQKKDYLLHQQYKPYYTELAECIREYLENRFQMKVLEMTTEEFLESLTEDRTLAKNHQQILSDFLQAADLVKFAKCSPFPAEAEKSLTLTRQLIEETKEVHPGNGNNAPGVNLTVQENQK